MPPSPVAPDYFVTPTPASTRPDTGILVTTDQYGNTMALTADGSTPMAPILVTGGACLRFGTGIIV